MTLHNTLLTPRRDGAAVKYLPTALAITALMLVGTAPAAAATHHHHYHRVAQSLSGLHMYAGESLNERDPVLGAMPMNEPRYPHTAT